MIYANHTAIDGPETIVAADGRQAGRAPAASHCCRPVEKYRPTPKKLVMNLNIFRSIFFPFLFQFKK